ncbi:MAG: tape measure protein, partial [Zoogloea sp.]|nr:tape measure protein [Zoogloea sp.]
MTDPKIRYDIEANATGGQSVQALAADLERLDASIDPALAERARGVAGELRTLGEQQASISEFVRLKEATAASSAALQQAQGAIASHKREMAASAEPTRAQIGHLSKLIDAARAAKTEHTANATSLEMHRRAMSAAGVETEGLAGKQVLLTQRERELVQLGRSIASSYHDQAAASAASASVQSRSHRQISEGVQSISQQLQRLQNLSLAAIGGNAFTQMAFDVAKTADAYNGLGARIRLVTGEGAEFKTAFEGVYDVARRTGVAAEQTGALFTRLAQAGKQIGLGNQEALALTETVNKAIQLSGASAQASDAAVTQLIQGLQGGVLRGEEFNSVMEQSPRLAQALADGLGKTTGELRKMAQAGALTSQVVIGALQGQANVIESEFSKLPPTVGRALSALQTSWQEYIGQTDQAYGVTSTAAKAITLVADNLRGLGTALVAAGQAWLGFKALDIATTLLSHASATGAATVATAAGTAATTANTAAKAANTTAIVANSTAQAANAVAARASATATAAATASTATGVAGILGTVGRLAGVFGAVGVAVAAFGGLAVDAFKAAGTWIGEGVAKLQGYRDATADVASREKARAEAAKAAKAAQAELDQQTERARDAALGLSERSKALVADFQEMRQKGKTAAQALADLAKAFDLGSLQGIADAGAALDKLRVIGEASAEDVHRAWAQALNGRDLRVFETQARAAFSGSANEAEKLGGVIAAIANESLRRAGTSVEELRTGFSAAMNSAMNDTDALSRTLDDLGVTGTRAGELLAKSLSKEIEAAKTEEAIKQVEQRVVELTKRFPELGIEGAAALAKIRAKADEIKPGLNSVAEAFKTLGMKSREELNQTASTFQRAWDVIRDNNDATIQQKIAAFQRYHAAAVEANGGVESSELRLQREIMETKARVSGLGDEFARSMSKAEKSTRAVTQALTEQRNAAAGSFSGDPGKYKLDPKGGDKVAGDPYGRTQAQIDALAGNTTGVDNSLPFVLREKYQAGTLTPNDLSAALAALSAAKESAYLTGTSQFSSFAAVQDAQQWVNTLQQIVDSLQSPGVNPGTGAGAGGLGGGNGGSSGTVRGGGGGTTGTAVAGSAAAAPAASSSSGSVRTIN